MLEIKKTAVSLDEKELLELQRIVIDGDEKEALIFLRRAIHEKLERSQRGRLKSHLDGNTNPVETFRKEQL